MKKQINRRDALKSLGAVFLAPALTNLSGKPFDRVFALPVVRADPKHKAIEKPLDCVVVGAGNRRTGRHLGRSLSPRTKF